MSILIKGMEMPTSCLECEWRDAEAGGDCELMICNPFETYAEQYKHCPFQVIAKRHPFVPVPPHGRLIDGDVAEVISFIDKDARGGDFADGVMYAVDFISELPTIIEAEPEVHVCDNCKWFGGLMCDHVDENYKCLGWEAEEVDNG